ncbi:hypothetical protein MUK42_07313 [Musa troglodytarum]|uniref:Uncharacterized protein n=1 Tax=Musa troglodytarum TaxID=320322 RepID=A0A9E7KT96_9LILI|nr:hypothetical protein MUK42_07313 [Musa troglodytarum]
MLAIRYVLRDAMADFSILYRIRSLRSLLKFLRSSVGSDDSIRLFLRSPTIPELRVVVLYFSHLQSLLGGSNFSLKAIKQIAQLGSNVPDNSPNQGLYIPVQSMIRENLEMVKDIRNKFDGGFWE